MTCDKCGNSTTNTENLILFEAELPTKKNLCNDCIFTLNNYLKQRWTSRESKQIREEHARLLRLAVEEEPIKPDD